MKISKFEYIISFLQGAMFSLALVGTFFIFLNYFWISLKYALSVAFIYLIFCMLIVAFLQFILIKIDLLKESKKQTSLLEEIRDRLDTQK